MHPQTLEIPSSLTVRNLAAFADQVRTCLNKGPLRLDPSAAEEIDLSALQLIIAARSQAAETGGSLTLTEPSSGALPGLLARAGFLAAATPADIDFWFHGVRPQ